MPTTDRYPTRIVVFCDGCGSDDTGEYVVDDTMDSTERLEIARSHMRTQG